MIDTMKTNIAYLFAGFLAVTMLSCSDDSEPLMMQEEYSASLVDYQTATEAQRALHPIISSQQTDGEDPDKKGQKGRDHREWYDVFGSGRIKNLNADFLSPGQLFAIDTDGHSPYIFKFYFPEEKKINDEFLGMRVYVDVYQKTTTGMYYYDHFIDAYPFHYDDTFIVPRDYLKEWHVLRCHLYNLYSGLTKEIYYDISFPDLVIIETLHK